MYSLAQIFEKLSTATPDWQWIAPALAENARALPLAALWLAALLLPGAGIALAISRRVRLDAAELGAVAASATLAVAGLVATVAYYASMSLAVVTASLGVVALAGAAWAVNALVRHREDFAFDPGGWRGWVLAALYALAALATGAWMAPGSDMFYHLAAVRTLARTNTPLVTDPFFGGLHAGIDPTAGSWHTLLASVTQLTGLDPASSVTAMTVACSVVFGLIVWSVLRRVTARPWAAFAIALVFILTATRLDGRAMVYPNNLSVALSTLSLVLLSRTIAEKSTGLVVAGALAGYAAAVTHLGGAQYFAIGGVIVFAWAALAWAATRRREAAERYGPGGMARIAVAGVAVALAASPQVLPRIAQLSGTIATGGDAGGGFVTLPTAVLPGIGAYLPVKVALGGVPTYFVAWVAVAAIALVCALRRRDGAAVPAIAIASVPLLTLANPLVSSAMIAYSAYMIQRIAMYMRFASYAALAFGLGLATRQMFRDRRQWWRLAAVALSAWAVLVSLWVAGPQLYRQFLTDLPLSVPWSRGLDVRATWAASENDPFGLDVIGQLNDLALDEDRLNTFAGDPQTLYALAGLSAGRIVASPETHTPFWMETAEGPARREAMARLLDPDTSATARSRVLRDYDVDWVVFDTAYPPQAAGLDAFDAEGYARVLESGDLVVVNASRSSR